MSDATHLQQVSKRPVWVWIISALFTVSAGYTLLSFILIYSGSIPISTAQKAYFASLSLVDHLAAITIASINITGACMLFLLKRTAPLYFLGAFALGIVSVAYQIVAKNSLSAMNGPAIVGFAIGQFLIVAVILYSFSLRKRGILR